MKNFTLIFLLAATVLLSSCSQDRFTAGTASYENDEVYLRPGEKFVSEHEEELARAEEERLEKEREIEREKEQRENTAKSDDEYYDESMNNSSGITNNYYGPTTNNWGNGGYNNYGAGGRMMWDPYFGWHMSYGTGFGYGNSGWSFGFGYSSGYYPWYDPWYDPYYGYYSPYYNPWGYYYGYNPYWYSSCYNSYWGGYGYNDYGYGYGDGGYGGIYYGHHDGLSTGSGTNSGYTGGTIYTDDERFHRRPMLNTFGGNDIIRNNPPAGTNDTPDSDDYFSKPSQNNTDTNFPLNNSRDNGINRPEKPSFPSTNPSPPSPPSNDRPAKDGGQRPSRGKGQSDGFSSSNETNGSGFGNFIGNVAKEMIAPGSSHSNDKGGSSWSPPSSGSSSSSKSQGSTSSGNSNSSRGSSSGQGRSGRR